MSLGLEAKRLLRTSVVARNNYGSGAEGSGHSAAMVWMTAAQTGHDPRAYLADYLTAYAQNRV